VGLDRFGRVVDQNWYNTNTSSSTDNFQSGYDQDGDVLYLHSAHFQQHFLEITFGHVSPYAAPSTPKSSRT
jgi:hypothetical protein